ncbi:Protein NDNF-1 [Aphelenchoides avenae]|nr:Protein NDNF-1 [Aphelenchus avenae]
MVDYAGLACKYFYACTVLLSLSCLRICAFASPFGFPPPAIPLRTSDDVIDRKVISSEISPGVEHTFLITPKKHSYFTFKVPTKNSPLWMYITPCGGGVHWRLYRSHEFAPQANTHPQSEHFNHILHKRIPPLVEFSKDLSNQLVLLAGEENEKRMTYYVNNVEAEYVVLNLTSTVPTTVKVFMTTLEGQINAFYPPLPADPRVNYSLLQSFDDDDEYELSLRWQIPGEIAALSHPKEGARDKFRYCALISRHRPDYTICDDLGENLESIHCVNQITNWLEAPNLRNGHKYFVTLFIRNTATGRSSALPPIEVNTPENPVVKDIATLKRANVANDYDELSYLHDAQLESGTLKPHRGYSVNYDFKIYKSDAEEQKALLILHACDGYIRVAVYRDGRLLKKSEPFSGYRRFLIVNAHSGHLRIQVINDDSKPTTYRLWASTKPEKSPYPHLPADTSVKETQRTCNSVTLQWMRSDEDATRYCLFRRKETANFLEELISRPANLCAEGMPLGDFVDCFQLGGTEPHNAFKTSNGLMQATVTGLEPDATYRFDLLATTMGKASPKFRPEQLPYRTAWVRTRSYC